MYNLNNGDVLMNNGNVYNPDDTYPGLNKSGYDFNNYESLPVQEATVTPDQMKQAVQTHVMNEQGAKVLGTTQNVEAPQIQPKYQIFAQQYQAQQAQQGNLPFTAPTKLSTIEDMLFSALGSYAVMRLLGAHSSPAWGVGLVAAGHALDQDNKMKDRYPALQRLLQQGYSYPAVMEWYETGKTASIEAEQKALSTERDAAANRAEQRYEFDQTQSATNAQNKVTNQENRIKDDLTAKQAGFNINRNPTPASNLGQAIALQESGENVNAKGNNGEVGAVQVKPKYFQQEAGYPAFNPNWDLPTQERWAEGLTRYRMQTYGFTQDQAIAAYNAGVPTVQAAITKAHNSNGQHDWTYYIPGGAGYTGSESQNTIAYVNGVNSYLTPYTITGNGVNPNNIIHTISVNGQSVPVKQIGKNGSGKDPLNTYQDAQGNVYSRHMSEVDADTSASQAAANQGADELGDIAGMSSDARNYLATPFGDVRSAVSGYFGSTAGAEAQSINAEISQLNAKSGNKAQQAAKDAGVSGINTDKEYNRYAKSMPTIETGKGELELDNSLIRFAAYNDWWNRTQANPPVQSNQLEKTLAQLKASGAPYNLTYLGKSYSSSGNAQSLSTPNSSDSKVVVNNSGNITGYGNTSFLNH
ncbi:transglycosylase SLT domain-containing protein [Klebsiella pneumoniae]|uniref:transglycosylase SLT domain-containing protein n=1 Tax=Klebsiella pneumoniae TaxID=573 RepID=UPI000E2BDF9E|nr:transglycosylase SLT domain-containing protein [Klebsiella pneumoniae]MBC4676299.1 transglycosylase SLT domain-containing protein [Klebsiella pneumoniae]MBX4492383.1 hypothetical protein [Klebsiella pneumoniae]MBZ1994389.1 transglycosylase SLT domain-containing protein [Klebsiella pneumoniae]MCP5666820.1 transglycosylase SLT domain-containing protein [Klebsiella pneumoniae]MDM9063541.1 transglycosylase SLT domain-containing protein [Klebsiella pneumoniae]